MRRGNATESCRMWHIENRVGRFQEDRLMRKGGAPRRRQASNNKLRNSRSKHTKQEHQTLSRNKIHTQHQQQLQTKI